MSKIKKSELLTRIEVLETKVTQAIAQMESNFYSLAKAQEERTGEGIKDVRAKLIQLEENQEIQANNIFTIHGRLDVIEKKAKIKPSVKTIV